MKLSAKTEYALLAMLQLAADYAADEPVQLRRIADEHGIPARFLVQILLRLKSAGLITSTRGAAGGYQLARPPQEVTLAEVIEVMEGDDLPRSSAGKRSPLVRALIEFCRETAGAQRDRLDAVTLAELVEQAAQREPMWYI